MHAFLLDLHATGILFRLKQWGAWLLPMMRGMCLLHSSRFMQTKMERCCLFCFPPLQRQPLKSPVTLKEELSLSSQPLLALKLSQSRVLAKFALWCCSTTPENRTHCYNISINQIKVTLSTSSCMAPVLFLRDA